MGLFANIAKYSFKTAADGKRLYCFAFTDYVIPDETTERRLFRKQLWIERIRIPAIFIGLIILFHENAGIHVRSIALVSAIIYFALGRVFLNSELKKLEGRVKLVSLSKGSRETSDKTVIARAKIRMAIFFGIIFATIGGLLLWLIFQRDMHEMNAQKIRLFYEFSAVSATFILFAILLIFYAYKAIQHNKK